MWLTILIVLLAPIVVILILAAMKPDVLRLERRATINATPDTVFAFLNDFHRWLHWSPWEGLDPALRRTHSGATAGKGAVYAWEGNKKVGQGQMEILESTPPSRLMVKLDFIKPFEAHNMVEFHLTPAAGGGTDIVWSMQGPQPFATKMFSVIMPMEKLIGKDFEKGLASLKRVSEAAQA
jgi:uncharacterized protein YndB with AHSA1/START domain